MSNFGAIMKQHIFNKFNPISLLTILTLLFGYAEVSLSQEEKYIGSTAIPEQLKSTQGWLIQNSKYGVSEVISAECFEFMSCDSPNEHMMWLQKFLGNKPDGKAIFEVVDVLNIPNNTNNKTQDKEQILPFCLLNNQSSPEIFALGIFEGDQDFFTKISKAWRVNLQTAQFESISTNNVKCINPAGANYDG